MSKIQLIDTHCHIHDVNFIKKYNQTTEEIIQEAKEAGINKLVCVGTDLISSQQAVKFCENRTNCHPTVALHPHEAKNYSIDELKNQIKELKNLLDIDKSIVAIGETGLDYFYHEDKEIHSKQEQLLRWHLELAVEYKLPLIFHVRDAFDEFFKIINDYKNLTGVVHSFTANLEEAERIINNGFYIGVNGIMTFVKDEEQLNAVKDIPLKNLLLETDAPFLTPVPFRGKMCAPKHLRVTADFLCELRGENLDNFAEITTKNAKALFGI